MRALASPGSVLNAEMTPMSGYVSQPMPRRTHTEVVLNKRDEPGERASHIQSKDR